MKMKNATSLTSLIMTGLILSVQVHIALLSHASLSVVIIMRPPLHHLSADLSKLPSLFDSSHLHLKHMPFLL